MSDLKKKTEIEIEYEYCVCLEDDSYNDYDDLDEEDDGLSTSRVSTRPEDVYEVFASQLRIGTDRNPFPGLPS